MTFSSITFCFNKRNCFRVGFSVVLFLLVLGLRSGFNSSFSGLPWESGIENIVILVLLPSLLILNAKFLCSKFAMLFLIGLLLLKILICIEGPLTGWSIKVYPGDDDLARDRWVSTYSTPWLGDASAILKEPWNSKRHFPLEWAIGKLTRSSQWAEKHSRLVIKDYRDTTPWLEINGSVLVPEGSRFILLSKGIVGGYLEANKIDNNKLKRVEIAENEISDDTNERSIIQLDQGVWQVSGLFHWGKEEWSLRPLIKYPNGDLKDAFAENTLFLPFIGKDAYKTRVIYGNLALLIDFLVGMFLVVWFAFFIRRSRAENYSLLPILGLSSTAIVLHYFLLTFLEKYSESNLETVSFGISIGVSAVGFLVWTSFQRELLVCYSRRIVQSMFILFGVPLLVLFAVIWWPELKQIPILSPGDDWTNYQLLAFQIGVWGDVWEAGEKIFVMQPLYRYFAAMLHWLFGHSVFAQKMLDVWCITGVLLVIVMWQRRLNFSLSCTVLCVLGVLLPIIMGPIRHLIGRGIPEFCALFFLLVAAFLLYGARDRSMFRIVVAGMSAVLGNWLRQDHLLISFALVFLIAEPITGSVKDIWVALGSAVKNQWRKGVLYLGIVSLGVFAIFCRNWWIGGYFGLTVPNHPNFWLIARCPDHPSIWLYSSYCDAYPLVDLVRDEIYNYYEKLRLLFTMKKVGQPPSMFSILLVLGVFSSLIALLWRPYVFRKISGPFGVVIASYCFTYLLVDCWGYPPRFSIHILPLATISCFMVVNHWVGQYSPNFKELSS